jgi:hypothetical protein
MNSSLFKLKLVGCLCALVHMATTASAAIITDNNLTLVVQPDLANTNNSYAIRAFPVQGRMLHLFSCRIDSTTIGIDMADYIIWGISKQAAPTSTVDLVAFWKDRTFKNGYTNATVRSFFTPEPDTKSLYVGVGFGRFDAHHAGNYRWLMSETRILMPTLADTGLMGGTLGNLVPNAGFEDSSANFWSKGTIVTSQTAPRESVSWR